MDKLRQRLDALAVKCPVGTTDERLRELVEIVSLMLISQESSVGSVNALGKEVDKMGPQLAFD